MSCEAANTKGSTLLNNRKTRTTTLAATGAVAAAAVSFGAASDANADTGVWDRVAQCESGGNWSINTGNGYYGGLQFSPRTWAGFGGTGSAANASKAEQIRVAQKVLAVQGPGAWPVCSVRAGLTKANGGAAYSGSTTKAPQQQTSRSTTRQAAPQQQAPVQKKVKKATVRKQYQAPKQQAPVQQAPAQQAPKKVKQHKHEVTRATPKVQSTGDTYTVKSGDTLSKIAEKLGLNNWKSLFHLNNDKITNPNLIFVGQVFDIPAK